RGHLNRVIVKPGDDVGAAAEETLERLRAARHVLQLDVEAFIPIEPKLARERGRKINQLILPADGDTNGAAGWIASAPAGAKTRSGQNQDQPRRHEHAKTGHSSVLFQRNNQRSSLATPMLTTTTTSARMAIPAN